MGTNYINIEAFREDLNPDNYIITINIIDDAGHKESMNKAMPVSCDENEICDIIDELKMELVKQIKRKRFVYKPKRTNNVLNFIPFKRDCGD